MKIFRKRYHPPGTSPGTLRVVESKVPLAIRLIDYTPERFTAKAVTEPAQCAPWLTPESITWIDVQGDVPPRVLAEVGHLLNLHALALEDALNRGQHRSSTQPATQWP
jgi:magnesium transporter